MYKTPLKGMFAGFDLKKIKALPENRTRKSLPFCMESTTCTIERQLVTVTQEQQTVIKDFWWLCARQNDMIYVLY